MQHDGATRLRVCGGLSVRVVQVIKLINSEHGSKPIQLKLKVRSLFFRGEILRVCCCCCCCACLPIDEWC